MVWLTRKSLELSPQNLPLQDCQLSETLGTHGCSLLLLIAHLLKMKICGIQTQLQQLYDSFYFQLSVSSAFPAVWIATSVGMFVKRDTTSKDTSTYLSSWCKIVKCFDTTCLWTVTGPTVPIVGQSILNLRLEHSKLDKICGWPT